MIRDMELLLNTVVDEQIKEYLSEAIRCYSVGCYRACVIISVIAGMYDLHKKLKSSAPSGKAFRDLDENVENAKKQLFPYERMLIDGCAKSDIDLLNSNESKELNRCLDIRNDCAHPSNYICTAETARYVYSAIIDILASRPVLLGVQNLNTLYQAILSDAYFLGMNPQEQSTHVKKQLKQCSPRVMKPLANKIIMGIQQRIFGASNYNLHIFLANMSDETPDFNLLIEPLITNSQYKQDIMWMLFFNKELLTELSKDNLTRILPVIGEYITFKGYEVCVSESLLAECYASKDFDDRIKKILNNSYQSMDETQSTVWLNVMNSSLIGTERKKMIIEDYCKGVDFITDKFSCEKYQDILITCQDDVLNSNYINLLASRVAQANYTTSNPATIEFQNLKIDYLKILSFKNVQCIVYSILKGSQGYGWEVQTLYQQLSTSSIFYIYCEMAKKSFVLSDIEFLNGFDIEPNVVLRFVELVSNEIQVFPSQFLNLCQTYLNSHQDNNVQIIFDKLKETLLGNNGVEV